MPNRVSRLRRSSCWGKAWLLGMTLYWWGSSPLQQQHHFGVLAFMSNPNGLVHSQATVLSKPNVRTFFSASTRWRVGQQLPKGQQKQHQQSTTQLHFMGSDGGVLGIGTPELFTILLVGYFVLGPSDLYKLVKEIGKFVQNFQTFTSEATASFENNLESQLQLEDIRKAQRELTDAFSFRRSINVDEDTEAFEVNAQSPRLPDGVVETAAEVAGGATAAVSTNGAVTNDDTTQPKKKIRRRRVKKQPSPTLVEGEDFTTSSTSLAVDKWNEGEFANDVPDLSVEDSWFGESQDAADRALREANEELRKEAIEAEAEERRKERIGRLQGSIDSQTSDQETEAASARFAAQLSGNWNGQILEKGDELSPLANIMERLALLEDEKKAADERLQEEFRLREENEERFYREKRKLLEEVAAQVQAKVYNLDGA